MRYQADAPKLKRWREERQWSQEHLASLSGLGVRTLQRIENGDQASPESLAALASAYNVDVRAITTSTLEQTQKTRSKELAALYLSLWIHGGSFVLGVFIFLAIGISNGDLLAMRVPLAWWFVGLAGHGLAVFIVTIATKYQQKYED